jgi:hypothetical protein
MKRKTTVGILSFVVISIAFITLIICYSNALPNAENNGWDDFFSHNFKYKDILKDTSEKSFPVGLNGVLYMETDGADIKIETWDKNEVYIYIEKRGDKERIENYRIAYSATPGRVEIYGKSERHFWNWGNFSITFTIKVPKQFNPEIRTSGGDIAIKDITGKILTKTSGGDIQINNCVGENNVITSGGDITISKITGDLKANTSGGGIKLREITGKIDAETSGGDIEAEVIGENKGIYLHTSGGDIDIYVSSEIKGDINCSTSGGSVSMNVPGIFSGETKDNKINGTLNGGGNEIKARTSGGDIKISSRER